MADVTSIASKRHEQREHVLRRLLDAQNAGDVDAALACFAHPRYELVGNLRVYDGPDEVRHYYGVIRHYFPDLPFDVIRCTTPMTPSCARCGCPAPTWARAPTSRPPGTISGAAPR